MTAAFAASPVFAQQGQQARFAFIIGNDLYQDAPLPTAANDAGLIADTLTSAGFDVSGARNLDQDTLRASYREFLAKVAAAGPDAVAFVYLSGHGLQYEGENYLVPAGATVARDSDIPLNAVRLSDLTKPLSGLQASAKIVVFDLAHPYPNAAAPGLALIEADPGTLIAMNAAPGTIGPNETGSYSAYAQALNEMISNPGLPLADVFDQTRLRVAALTKGAEVPWDASRIDQPFVFFAPAPGAPPPEVAAVDVQARISQPIKSFPTDQAYAAALERDTLQGYEDFLAAYPSSPYAKSVRGLLAARREALTWRRTLDVGSPDAYWSYLRRYPKGPHAVEARQILGTLSAALQPPPNFVPLAYDVPPPPPVEVVYFDAPQPVFYDPEYAPPPPPVIFLPPPPPWWAPPPPPRIAPDNVYFLPGYERRDEPEWRRPPPYVEPPPQPVFEHGPPPPGERIAPLVAIPAAVAAGIAAGRLIKGSSGGPTRANLPGGQPPRGAPLIPPVTAPPKGPVRPGPAERLAPPVGGPAAGLPPAGGPSNLPHPGAGNDQRPGLPPSSTLKTNEPPPHGAPPPPPGSKVAEPSPPSSTLRTNELPQHGAPPPPPGPKVAEPSPPSSTLRTNEPPPRGAPPPPPGSKIAEPPPPSSTLRTNELPPHGAPPPPPGPKIAEPSPPKNAAPPRPELRSTEPPPKVSEPPPPRLVEHPPASLVHPSAPPVEPHVERPPPPAAHPQVQEQVHQAPPPHQAAPPPQRPEPPKPSAPACGHPGQPPCK